MDDLEKAILLTYDPSSTPDSSIRSQALAYINQIKSLTDPSSLLRLCLDLLHRSSLIPVQFWSLQTLHDSLYHHYPSLSQSTDLPMLRSSLVALSTSSIAVSPPFLKNKLAQTLAFLIRLEYPSLFQSPFFQLMPDRSSMSSPAAVDFFSRLLSALDDDLISQDYPRSADESAAATRVKDAMRLQCVPQIVSFFFEAVNVYKSSDPNLATAVLETMRKYVSWIDIGLVANRDFLSLLFNLMQAHELPDCLRSAAAGCVLAVVLKRMDHRQKLALLQTLKPQLGRVFADTDFAVKIGSLITGYAAEALECYKKLGSDEGIELVEETLPSLFYVTENSDESDFGNVVGFLSDYVAAMKSSPSQKQVLHIGRILELIYSQMQYDQSYRRNLDIPDKIGKEEEDQMCEDRKDLFTLFRSVCRVNPNVTVSFIRNLLANALSSSNQNVEEVEASLSLFYQLGETVSEEEMKSGSGLLGELVPMLLSARFSCHSHRIVALVYLETITRYLKFVHENTQYIHSMLAAFLDERGIRHLNLNVGRRASYLFMRAVKLLKAKLVPFIETILQNLQDMLARYTCLDWSSKELKCSGSEDGSYTFEAIGLLIGMEDVPPEKQTEYLSALLNPLCQQVKSLLLEAKVQGLDESSVKVVHFQQIIMALNALSKGFNERLIKTSRPAIGIMFKQTLDVLIQILVEFPNIKPLRNKVTSFLHRMVDILGKSVFPCLRMAFKQLLVESEPKDTAEFLVLINQVICKFDSDVADMLEEIFPVIASRLFSTLSSDAFPSGPGCNTEEIRELQELQRTFYTFLHVMATHNLSSIFLAANSRGYLDAIMQLLLLTSCRHKDVVVRKMCVQIFVKLMEDWCTKYNGEDKVPGFRSFIIEKFASNCCLYSVLDKSFQLRDANSLVLFGEIVLAQKIMYEKFGNDFLIHFVTHTLLAAHCPQDLAEQYYQKFQPAGKPLDANRQRAKYMVKETMRQIGGFRDIQIFICMLVVVPDLPRTFQQGSDIKALRAFYQSLIEKLRQEQNGSLVFR